MSNLNVFDLDRELSLLRLALCLLALGLVVARAHGWLGGTARARRAVAGAMLALGALSYASYYYFFQLHHRGGFETEDVFHYYVGSKYFDELGYFGLYEATVLALVESDARKPDSIARVRDLRSMRALPPQLVLSRAHAVKRRFSPERWQLFTRDVRWFHARLNEAELAHLLVDHGYHPPPAWTWLGGLFSSRVRPGSWTFWALVRADRVLVAIGLVALGWAFGAEVAGLAAVVWGTGFLWRYGWLGDSFLRQLWLCSTLVGIACLGRGRQAAGGALLATSAWLRIFPGVLAAGALARAGIEAWRHRPVPRAAVALAAGVAVASLAWAGAGLSVGSSPASVYPEFVSKLRGFAASDATNKVGLGVLTHALLAQAPRESIAGTAVTRPARWAQRTATALRWLVIAVALALWLRGLRAGEPWQAACASAALIPFLSDPTGYYYAFCVAFAPLARVRSRVAPALLSACAAWSVVGLVLYRDDTSYVAASAVAVALGAFVLWEMARVGAGAAAIHTPDAAGGDPDSPRSSVPTRGGGG